jgi:hypothetical protein
MDGAAVKDDCHNAAASGLLAVWAGRSPEVLLQAATVIVNLRAGCAQAGDFDDGFGAEMESCAAWKGEEIYSSGENVLADLTGLEREAESGEFGQHLGGEEMDLCEIGLCGVLALEVDVLRDRAAVRITLHSFASDEMQ